MNEEIKEVAKLRYIYKYTNKINGKIYVGQTTNLKKRKAEQVDGKVLKSGRISLIELSIRKYGIENFTHEVLEKGIWTKEGANKIEGGYIKLFDCLAPKGMNIRGEDDNIYSINDLEREKMGPRRQGKTNKNKKYTSDFLGVHKLSNNTFKLLVRRLYVNGEKVLISRTFEDEITAAESYDKTVLFLYGTEAVLNFPEKRAEYLMLDLEKELDDLISSRRRIKHIKYKWVSPKSGKWTLDLPKKKGLRLLPYPSLPQVEMAYLADQLAFLFYGVGIHELNFPEKIKEYDLDALKQSLVSYFSFGETGVYFNKKTKNWSANLWNGISFLHLGSYKDQESASSVRKIYSELYYRSEYPDVSKLSGFKVSEKAIQFLLEKHSEK